MNNSFYILSYSFFTFIYTYTGILFSFSFQKLGFNSNILNPPIFNTSLLFSSVIKYFSEHHLNACLIFDCM